MYEYSFYKTVGTTDGLTVLVLAPSGDGVGRLPILRPTGMVPVPGTRTGAGRLPTGTYGERRPECFLFSRLIPLNVAPALLQSRRSAVG
jgi:hypothetical protein